MNKYFKCLTSFRVSTIFVETILKNKIERIAKKYRVDPNWRFC